jgi:hypothetical protein
MRLLAIAAGLATFSASAGAMQFSRGDAGLLQFEGEIVPGDYDRMIAFFQSDPRTFVAAQLVLLNSPGGSVKEAIRIARFIRDTSRSTLVQSGSSCKSACFFLLVAGGYREVNRGAHLGIHRPYYSAAEYGALSPAQARQAYDHLDTVVRQFLEEMRITPSVVKMMFDTPSTSMKMLDRETFARTVGSMQPWYEELESAACPRQLIKESVRCMGLMSAKERVDQLPQYLGAELARRNQQWLVEYKRTAEAALSTAARSSPATPDEIVSQSHPGWKEAVRLPEFRQWLEAQPSEIRRLAASDKPADAVRLLDEYKARTATGAMLYLSCALAMNDARRTPDHLDLVVDLDRQTVGGLPASVTADSIRHIKTLTDGDTMTMSVSRLSGAVTLVSERLGKISAGKCTPAAKQRF